MAKFSRRDGILSPHIEQARNDIEEMKHISFPQLRAVLACMEEVGIRLPAVTQTDDLSFYQCAKKILYDKEFWRKIPEQLAYTPVAEKRYRETIAQERQKLFYGMHADTRCDAAQYTHFLHAEDAKCQPFLSQRKYLFAQFTHVLNKYELSNYGVIPKHDPTTITLPPDVVVLPEDAITFLEQKQPVESFEYAYQALLSQPIEARHLQRLVTLPYECGLYHSGVQLLLVTGNEHTADITDENMRARKQSHLRLHTHVHKEGYFNSPSYPDLFSVDQVDDDQMGQQGQQHRLHVIAHKKGLLFFDWRSPRDMRDEWQIFLDEHRIVADELLMDQENQRTWELIPVQEKARLQRTFAETHHCILQESSWEDHDQITKMVEMINQQRSGS
ncbi:MAG TPA: hypothetical protein VJB65_03565 [Patescibacteria group bacterium]|nr:hypothetical protein [Patescibacteria group bacterium]